MDNNSNRDKGYALLFGLAAGAAIGWWLNSDKGRAVRKSTIDTMSQYSEDVSRQASQKWEQTKSTLNDAVSKGQEYINEASEKVKSTVSQYADKAEDAIDNYENSFEKGVNKAQDAMNKKADELNSTI